MITYRAKPGHVKTEAYRGYMCRIDFECERGEPMGGNRFFADIEDLRKEHDCADDCGIVEVEISLVRVVVEGTD